MKLNKSLALGLMTSGLFLSIETMAENILFLDRNDILSAHQPVNVIQETINLDIKYNLTQAIIIHAQSKIDLELALKILGRDKTLEYLKQLSKPELEHKFYKAILKDNYVILELFIEAGIDVNKEIDGHYPLAIAIKKNKPNACKALLNANANYNITIGSAHYLPIYYALDRNFMEIATLLTKKGAQCYRNHETFERALSAQQKSRTWNFNHRLGLMHRA